MLRRVTLPPRGLADALRRTVARRGAHEGSPRSSPAVIARCRDVPYRYESLAAPAVPMTAGLSCRCRHAGGLASFLAGNRICRTSPGRTPPRPRSPAIGQRCGIPRFGATEAPCPRHALLRPGGGRSGGGVKLVAASGLGISTSSACTSINAEVSHKPLEAAIRKILHADQEPSNSMALV